jgi:type I restriction enzyme S subunit
MKWREVTLNEICTTQYGYTASAREEKVGPKMLRITDIVPESINWSSVPFCEIDEAEISKYRLNVGDILIARTGNTTGYAKLIRDDVYSVFASYLVRLKVDAEIADPQYVGRLVESKFYKTFVDSIKGGSAQGNANAKTLTMFKFKLPSLPTQQKIADFLSKYDDLIENNRRRIELLEESARSLYREWFVYLRFPGHEHTPIIDGIPEGWEKGTISDFYKTTSGGTPSRKNPDFFTGDINWVKTQELNNGFIFDTEDKITEQAIKSSSAKLLPENTVLVAMYGATIGETGVLVRPATTNQACCGLITQHQNANYMYLFLFLLENKQGLINLSQGAAQNNISQAIIKSYPMLFPNQFLIEIFTETIKPIFDQIKNLYLQNIKLSQARDLLLPRLMNGEIAV